MRAPGASAGRPRPRSGRWLLLFHQLPPKPAYVRVKVRRRLERIGAVLLKNSVYVLPNTPETLEDLQWLRAEIVHDGGEATICDVAFVEGARDAEVRRLFRRAPAAAEEMRPRGVTWVTRKDVQVDRIASAWLIRRFIDPAARFRFVAATGHRPKPGERRFDMFEGEYTHEGARCTFETLLARFGLADRALAAIGEVVHDIDCKDDRYRRAGTQDVANLVRGIVRAHGRDRDRLSAGAVLFDGLYARLAAPQGPTARAPSRRGRPPGARPRARRGT